MAGWTFPGSSVEADTGLIANLGQELTTEGGTSDIEFKNGIETKAAQVTQWNGGANSKAWVISVNTSGTSNLSVGSRQQSGGNDPGPRYFKVQYSVDEGNSWVDVEDGAIEAENDWETSFVDHLLLPDDCEDQEKILIRWLMTSEEASGDGGDVLESGKNKIDNIFIHGELINGIHSGALPGFTISPGSSLGRLSITSPEEINQVDIYTMNGQKCTSGYFNSRTVHIQVPASVGGQIVICRISWKKNSLIATEKVFLH